MALRETKQELLQKTQQLAEEHGGVCRESEFISKRWPMQFVCRCGHEFVLTYAALVQNIWCVECRDEHLRELRARLSEMMAVEQGSVIRHISGRTLVSCRHGHKWEVSVRYVLDKTWRPVCVTCARKITKDVNMGELLSLMKRNGFVLVRVEKERVVVRCMDYGHESVLTVSSLVHGKRCSRCYAFRKKMRYKQKMIRKRMVPNLKK